jgi:hypothetical protein
MSTSLKAALKTTNSRFWLFRLAILAGVFILDMRDGIKTAILWAVGILTLWILTDIFVYYAEHH